MNDPKVNLLGDLSLSADADVSEEQTPIEITNDDGVTDSETNVPRETVDDSDPVGEAVAVAVQQWVGFDPAIHATNPDGSPRLKVDGTYARKRGRGGRKSGDDSGSADLFTNVSRETMADVPRETPQTDPAQPSPTAAPTVTSQQTATMLVLASTTVLARLIGPEWAAEKDELKSLTTATKIYFDSKGGVQMSPELGLFLAVSMYAVPRAAHENTRSKLGKCFDWCKDRFAVVKARFNRVKIGL